VVVGVAVEADNSTPDKVDAAPDKVDAAPDKVDAAPNNGMPQLDLVFTMDCTGSMGEYIHAAKKNIEAIVERLVQSEGYDLRFALVAYRDHPPQDQTFVTKTFGFTSELTIMQGHLATLSAQGGGDGPEAVGAALKATLEQQWRPDATKVCVLIADAPPHGLGESGDGFPDGAPDGVDPLETLERMSMKGICIYSVGCEPALSGYRFAKDFFIAAARKTNGQAVQLTSAASLADVIMGGAIEEMDLEKLSEEVVREVRTLREAAPGLSDEAYLQQTWENLHERGHMTRHMTSAPLRSSTAEHVYRASTLAEARTSLGALPRTKAPKAFTSMDLGAPRKKRGMGPMGMRGGGVVDRGLSDELGEVMSAAGMAVTESDEEDECEEPTLRSLGAAEEEDFDEPALTAGGGVRLETRALSFGQMERIFGKQKKMGTLG
jgi:Mg-chelatase subunit ChlD